MTPRIHDSEPDLSLAAVQALLDEHAPAWVDRPIHYVSSSGTTNALFRIAIDDGTDIALRLPRTAGASRSIEMEATLLPALAKTHVPTLTRIPVLLHHGEPTDAFPFHWAALDWIDGNDLWAQSPPHQEQLATILGQLVNELPHISGMPVPQRHYGERGGPLAGVLESLDQWLSNPDLSATDLVDVSAIRRLADEAAELVSDTSNTSFVHGDLLPGNILAGVDNGTALIDWGAAGYGDRAQDLAPYWAIFEGQARAMFRDVVDQDEAAWLRARTNELEHTVGGILYYRPRGHLLADVMEHTLNQILNVR